MSYVFLGALKFTNPFAIAVDFTSTQSGDTWSLINIYGPCSGSRRLEFIDWLFALDIPVGEDWLFVGDFNLYRAPDNMNRAGGNVNDMLTFNDFIRAQSLVELPIKGRAFSWSNMQQDPLLVQLDWHFTSINWASKYPNTVVMPLGKLGLDHSPCYVCIQTRIPKAKIFRFEEFWISAPGFFDTVASAWNRPHFASNSAKLLCKKMKSLRYALKNWSKGLSHLTSMISNSNQVLLDLDQLEDRRPLSTPEYNFRLILKKHLINLLDRRKCYWKNRCTVRFF